MKVISELKKMRAWSIKARTKGASMGFVPTMGCLHQGHLSLLRKARKENDYLIVSIFVNPAQFGPGEDFKLYPRNFARDKKLIAECGADVIFYPRVEDMYSHGFDTFVSPGKIGTVLCGMSRPGHFRGVCTVVLKLFNIVGPDRAYFGQKDAQQAIIIQKMIKDLDVPVKIKVLPIVREKDGLAMSSRNAYLSASERESAVVLYRSLQFAVGMIKLKYRDPRKIIRRMEKMIKAEEGTRIDYIKIVDTVGLHEVKKIKGDVLISLAVFFGRTRLIDNARIYV